MRTERPTTKIPTLSGLELVSNDPENFYTDPEEGFWDEDTFEDGETLPEFDEPEALETVRPCNDNGVRYVGVLALVLALFLGACQGPDDAPVCPASTATTPAEVLGEWVWSYPPAPVDYQQITFTADDTFTRLTSSTVDGNYSTTIVTGRWGSPGPGVLLVDGACHSYSVTGEGLVLTIDDDVYAQIAAKLVSP